MGETGGPEAVRRSCKRKRKDLLLAEGNKEPPIVRFLELNDKNAKKTAFSETTGD